MANFFKLRSDEEDDQVAVGNSIIAVSNSVYSGDIHSEWAQFNANPRAWIQRYYDYCDARGGLISDGKIPGSVVLVPVYDTDTHVHVRIPWRGDLKAAEAVPMAGDSDEGPGGFPAELARYFMRRCR